MLENNFEEDHLAERRGKAKVEVIRLVIYITLVAGIAFLGWLLGEAMSPLFSIFGFALAVFVIAVMLPMIEKPLHGGLVDTIYYSSAIVATLVIFIANGNERMANQIGLEIEEQEQSLEQARFRLSRLEVTQEQNEDLLEKLREKLVDANEAINTPGAAELQRVEAELSSEMIKALGVDKLIEVLPQRLSRCDTSRQNLSTLTAQAFQLEVERNFNIGPRLGAAARGRELNARDAMIQSMIQAAADEVAICDRFQSSAEKLLSAPDSYARLLGLVTISDLVDTSWGGLGNGPQARARLSQVEEFEEIRRTRNVLTGNVNTLENRVSEGRAELAAGSSEIVSIETEIGVLEKNLDETRSNRLAGSIARAKDWGDRIWPFLLISLLGMKLARKPLFALR